MTFFSHVTLMPVYRAKLSTTLPLTALRARMRHLPESLSFLIRSKLIPRSCHCPASKRQILERTSCSVVSFSSPSPQAVSVLSVDAAVGSASACDSPCNGSAGLGAANEKPDVVPPKEKPGVVDPPVAGLEPKENDGLKEPKEKAGFDSLEPKEKAGLGGSDELAGVALSPEAEVPDAPNKPVPGSCGWLGINEKLVLGLSGAPPNEKLVLGLSEAAPNKLELGLSVPNEKLALGFSALTLGLGTPLGCDASNVHAGFSAEN